MLIKDTAQRLRAAAPNEFGMNPLAAERLISLGRDPRQIAESIAARSRSQGRRMVPAPQHSGVKKMELSIDYRDVTTRQILEQAALRAYEPEFIAEEVAPSVFVDDVKGTVILEDSTQERREVRDDAAAAAAAGELPSAVLTIAYNCTDRVLEDYQTRQDAEKAPAFLSIARMTERTARKAKRQHEIRTKTALMTAANYASSTRRALSSGYNWNGGASADPIADMQAVLASMYAPATHAVMSLEAWQAVQSNDVLRGILATQIANAGLLSPMVFGAYWGIPNVEVDEQRYTPIGSDTQTRLYDSDKIAILHVSADPYQRTFLRNFMFRSGNGGFTVLAWYDEARGSKGSDRVKVSFSNDLAVVDNTYGGIITGVRA